MIIKKYGLELHRLTEEDIELVRQARNRNDIRLHMMDQQIITPAQQAHWFKSINNGNNFYFVIHYNNKKIGLINSKNVDWLNKTDEGGIFIWDKDYIGAGVSAKASIIILQLSFLIIGLEKNIITINPNNTSALHYNKALGYEVYNHKNKMVITKASFLKRLNRLLNIAAPKNKTNKQLSFSDISFYGYKDEMTNYVGLPVEIYNLFLNQQTQKGGIDLNLKDCEPKTTDFI